MIKKDIERLASDHAILDKEWTSLSKSEAPLTILEREKVTLESDKEKFKAYITHLEGKKQKLIDTRIALAEEFEASEEHLKKLSVEREELVALVDGQELSPSDVDRMNAERDQLAKTLFLLSQQLDEVNKNVWNEEIGLQKKMDALERATDKLNAFLYKLDLLGSKDSRYSSVSKEIELFLQQGRPESMVSVDLRNQVKPVLQSFIDSFRNEAFKVTDETIALQGKVDVLAWNVTKKEEEVNQVLQSIKTLNDRYNHEKEVN